MLFQFQALHPPASNLLFVNSLADDLTLALPMFRHGYLMQENAKNFSCGRQFNPDFNYATQQHARLSHSLTVVQSFFFEDSRSACFCVPARKSPRHEAMHWQSSSNPTSF